MKVYVKGKIERRIIKELAQKPHQLIKPLSETIHKDYRSVYNAVSNLHKKRFIKKGKKMKTRGGLFPSYKLTQKGLALALTYKEVDQLITMKNYEEDYKPILSEYTRLNEIIDNPSLMKKTLSAVGKLHLAYPRLKPNAEKMFGVATTTSIVLNGMTAKEKKELLEAIHSDKKLSKALKLVVKELGL